jgi:hypothetical protein
MMVTGDLPKIVRMARIRKFSRYDFGQLPRSKRPEKSQNIVGSKRHTPGIRIDEPSNFTEDMLKNLMSSDSPKIHIDNQGSLTDTNQEKSRQKAKS